VQWIVRHTDYRGSAGRVASGTLRAGARVRLLPSDETTRIARIETPRGEADEARAGESVVVHLEGDHDVARGETIVAEDEPAPRVTSELVADVAWVHKTPGRAGATYLLKHQAREVRAVLESIEARYDVASGATVGGGDALELNALGRVRLRTSEPLVVDAYSESRETGSALLVDAATGETLAGAMCV